MADTYPYNDSAVVSRGAGGDALQYTGSGQNIATPPPTVTPTQQPQAQPNPVANRPAQMQQSPQGGNGGALGQSADSKASTFEFSNYLQTAIDKLNQTGELTKQRQLLIKHLYDSPLNYSELQTLPKPIQDAINSGDRSNIEMQLRLLNDGISGRANTLNQSVDFLTTAYTKSLEEADKKKEDAQKIIEDSLNRSGSLAFQNYPTSVKRQLEKAAGYPDGYLDYVSPTINQTRYAAQYGSGLSGASVTIPQNTIAYRTNNPLNIKFSTTTAGFGGTDSGIAGQDGGTFARFNSPEAGLQAAQQLLTSPSYANLSVDDAMKRWSNNGYGADVTTISPERTISSLSPDELDQLIGDMAQRESGATITAAGVSPLSNTKVGSVTFGTVPSGVTQTNALNGQSIIDGKQPPTIANSISGAGFQIKAYLAANGYDLTSATQDWEAIKKWQNTINSATYQRAIVAADSANKYIKNLRTLSDEWDRSNFPPLTKAELTLALNGVLGKDAQTIAQKVQTQIADLEADMASVYRYGLSSTDSSLENAAKTLSTDWGKARLDASLDVIDQNLQVRINSLKTPSNAISASGTGQNQYVGGEAGADNKDPIGIR